MATNLPVDASELWLALEQQSRIRVVALPSRIVSPGENWDSKYAGRAKEYARGDHNLTDLQKTLELVGLQLNPVLEQKGDSSGTWDFEGLAWR